jgi:hypothetical protein
MKKDQNKSIIEANAALNFNDLRAKAKLLNISTKNMKKEDILEAVNQADIAAAAPKKGRPAVEGSARQLRLAKYQEKINAGLELKRGRPVLEGSERQKRLAAIEAKRKAGMEIKPGRPKQEKVEEQPVLDLKLEEVAA